MEKFEEEIFYCHYCDKVLSEEKGEHDHGCLTCHGEPWQVKIDKLEAENKKLNDFCKEFVWGEDNPDEYDTLHSKCKKLDQEKKELIEALENLSGVLDFCDEIVEQNHEVTNFHMNGDTEPVMNFWEENGADFDSIEKAREVLAKIKSEVRDEY